MIRIMGIDPGSRFTGFGIIDVDGNKVSCCASGHIKVTGAALSDKLGVIYENISELYQLYKPHEAAIEKVFMHRNADSALKLGQARGAAITAIVNNRCSIAEYSATQIKQSIVGKGNASKDQVQHMVKSLLKLESTPQSDAADALAIALCHSFFRTLINTTGQYKGVRAGRILR